MSKPLKIARLKEEPDIEYLLRHAAAFIRQYAKDKEIYHEYYSDNEPVTGEEVADSLLTCQQELAGKREKLGQSMKFTGTVTQAGSDPETGTPRVTISTNVEELKIQKSIPFYKRCEIEITPI